MISFGDRQSRNYGDFLPFLFSFTVISAVAFTFWPGYMSPDSISQLNQGLTGNYSDHHPPMMSFFWKIFNFIYAGPQIYLIFQLSLLLFAICILQTIVKQKWLKIIVSLIPLIPSIGAYSGALWKDVGFAYSFLLAGMMLTKSNVSLEKLGFHKTLLILLLLIYGVGVKYQAQFVCLLWGYG